MASLAQERKEVRNCDRGIGAYTKQGARFAAKVTKSCVGDPNYGMKLANTHFQKVVSRIRPHERTQGYLSTKTAIVKKGADSAEEWREAVALVCAKHPDFLPDAMINAVYRFLGGREHKDVGRLREICASFGVDGEVAEAILSTGPFADVAKTLARHFDPLTTARLLNITARHYWFWGMGEVQATTAVYNAMLETQFRGNDETGKMEDAIQGILLHSRGCGKTGFEARFQCARTLLGLLTQTGERTEGPAEVELVRAAAMICRQAMRAYSGDPDVRIDGAEAVAIGFDGLPAAMLTLNMLAEGEPPDFARAARLTYRAFREIGYEQGDAAEMTVQAAFVTDRIGIGIGDERGHVIACAAVFNALEAEPNKTDKDTIEANAGRLFTAIDRLFQSTNDASATLYGALKAAGQNPVQAARLALHPIFMRFCSDSNAPGFVNGTMGVFRLLMDDRELETSAMCKPSGKEDAVIQMLLILRGMDVPEAANLPNPLEPLIRVVEAMLFTQITDGRLVELPEARGAGESFDDSQEFATGIPQSRDTLRVIVKGEDARHADRIFAEMMLFGTAEQITARIGSIFGQAINAGYELEEAAVAIFYATRGGLLANMADSAMMAYDAIRAHPGISDNDAARLVFGAVEIGQPHEVFGINAMLRRNEEIRDAFDAIVAAGLPRAVARGIFQETVLDKLGLLFPVIPRGPVTVMRAIEQYTAETQARKLDSPQQ